jgi:glycosyltransferase involved in cell wall biosynthesis
MLAKGVPIIGNAMGGITDYLKPGVTGWLNTDNSAAGLAAIVRHVIAHPEQIVALNALIGRTRSSLIKPMETHRAEMEQLYAEAARNHLHRKTPSRPVFPYTGPAQSDIV